MRLVVDTNVLLTFFWKNSAFNSISIKQELELFSPVYALEEINKHSSEILTKAKLSQKEFKKIRNEFALRVEFIPLEEYSSFLKKAFLLTNNLLKNELIEFSNDIDFFALALKLDCAIWSNDKLFKKQPKIKVFNTKEVISIVAELLELD